jgi:hypothetical protein
MTQEFKPVVYLKNGCKFCFKVGVAVLEMGLFDKVEIRAFSPGTLEETEIRQSAVWTTRSRAFIHDKFVGMRNLRFSGVFYPITRSPGGVAEVVWQR